MKFSVFNLQFTFGLLRFRSHLSFSFIMICRWPPQFYIFYDMAYLNLYFRHCGLHWSRIMDPLLPVMYNLEKNRKGKCFWHSHILSGLIPCFITLLYSAEHLKTSFSLNLLHNLIAFDFTIKKLKTQKSALDSVDDLVQ